jgi:hypothetical protein
MKKYGPDTISPFPSDVVTSHSSREIYTFPQNHAYLLQSMPMRESDELHTLQNTNCPCQERFLRCFGLYEDRHNLLYYTVHVYEIIMISNNS